MWPYFKFNLILVGDINLNSWPNTTTDKNNNVWDDFPFPNWDLFVDWTENQTSFDSGISNSDNNCSMSKIRGMQFIYLNINSLLP